MYLHRHHHLHLDRLLPSIVQRQVEEVAPGHLDCNELTSMKIPSIPTATAVLATAGISSLRPPLATPPPCCMQTTTCVLTCNIP